MLQQQIKITVVIFVLLQSINLAPVIASIKKYDHTILQDTGNEIVNFPITNIKNDETQTQYSFSSGQISKHQLEYDPQLKAIIFSEEIGVDKGTVNKTNFNHNGFNYLTEIYDADGNLIHCKT